jgi:hypothetical protein
MSKLTYANIIREAVMAVSTDSALLAWCNEKYSLPPSVRNDLDPMNPPEESECPLIAFSPVGGQNGQDQSGFLRAFIVRVAVSDTETEETGRILTQIFKGTDNVSHLLENLVYPALYRRFNFFGCPISTTDEEIEMMQGTLFQAKAGLTIILEKTIGEERPFL